MQIIEIIAFIKLYSVVFHKVTSEYLHLAFYEWGIMEMK